MNRSYYRNPEIPNNDFDNPRVPLQINCTGTEFNKEGLKASSVRKDYYLFYLEEGSITVEKPVLCKLNKGSLIIFGKGDAFSYRSEETEAARHCFVHFTGSECEKLLNTCKLSVNRPYEINRSLNEEFEALYSSFLMHDSLFDTDSAAKFILLLTAVSRAVNEKSNPSPAPAARLCRSLEYIHGNFTKEISVHKLAKIENMSISRYRTLFGQCMKCSPTEYISALRLNFACSLLSSRDMSIEEVSSAAGYSDSRYFSRIFKKKLGVSPSEYRKNHKIN